LYESGGAMIGKPMWQVCKASH